MRRAILAIGCMALLIGGQALAQDFNSNGSIVAGELWDSVSTYDTPPNHTTVNMSGGTVFSMHTYDASMLNMTGGKIYNLNSHESSTANLSGNDHSSPFNISAWDQSIINFSGNIKASFVDVYNTATINITGGTEGNLSAYNSGIINIYSGGIGDALAQDNAIINVFGKSLIKVSTGGAFDYGFVQGHYNDNSDFYFDFRGPNTYSRVNLIPEPVTIFLLGVGGLFLKKKD